MTAEAAGARDAATAEAEAEAAVIKENAAQEAERVIAEAREDAEALTEAAAELRREAAEEKERIIEEAKDEGRAMLAEAKDVRTRILEDLQRRRDLGRSQVERLAAGRDQLLDAYAAVRANIDEITAKLEVGLLETGSSGHDPLLDDGFAGIVISGLDDHDDADDGEDAHDEDGELGVDGSSAEAEPGADQAEAASTDDADDGADEDVAADAGDDTAEADEAHPDVDALFAKIRADRAESVARAQQVLAGDDDTAAEPRSEAEEASEVGASAAADEASAETDDDTGEPDDTAETDNDTAGYDRVPAELLADEDARTARSMVLDRLDKALTRALKRHLADEQNVVLDALRRSESTDLADLLPPAADHIAGYAAVAAVELAAAAEAGAAVVDDDVSVDIAALADELGTALVEPFRRRIERSASEVDGDADALDERLRALYREWKVEHIGALASDALLSAYAAGPVRRRPGRGHAALDHRSRAGTLSRCPGQRSRRRGGQGRDLPHRRRVPAGPSGLPVPARRRDLTQTAPAATRLDGSRWPAEPTSVGSAPHASSV